MGNLVTHDKRIYVNFCAEGNALLFNYLVKSEAEDGQASLSCRSWPRLSRGRAPALILSTSFHKCAHVF